MRGSSSPPDSIELFALYDQLYAATNGAVDPLVGKDLELLGYDADYSLTPHPDSAEARDRPRWPADVPREGRWIATSRAVVIDVGAAGKGYLVDQIAALLGRAGIMRAVVDGSGDLRVGGNQTVRVGLEHPTSPGQAIGVAEVGGAMQGRALCASAVNRRRWGRGLHHVIDGRTGRPTEDVLATWVIADRAAVADGVATALFFADPDRLTDRFDFRYVRIAGRRPGRVVERLPRRDLHPGDRVLSRFSRVQSGSVGFSPQADRTEPNRRSQSQHPAAQHRCEEVLSPVGDGRNEQ